MVHTGPKQGQHAAPLRLSQFTHRASSMTAGYLITIQAVPFIDHAARALTRLCGLPGVGVFWVTGAPARLNAWREPVAWNLVFGRLELVVDLHRA